MKTNTPIWWDDEGTKKKGTYHAKSSVPGKCYIWLEPPTIFLGEEIVDLVMEKDVTPRKEVQ